jgi:predicted phosphodiesterase
MQVLIISDIHANLTALEAVLDAAKPSGYEAVWCLGDLIGYGPDPNDCVERVRELPDLVCLIGNHDQAALGKIPLERFNEDAREAAAWTREQLADGNEAYLLSLPSRVSFDEFTLAHGSPRQPVWEYILDPQTAEMNFRSFHTPYCLVGHSHLPLGFYLGRDNSHAELVSIPWDRKLDLEPRMILNPGSVGQPRDMDPRAAYAILDTDTATWEAFRVEYDVEQVQRRMIEAGLPERQALRLMSGW